MSALKGGVKVLTRLHRMGKAGLKSTILKEGSRTEKKNISSHIIDTGKNRGA